MILDPPMFTHKLYVSLFVVLLVLLVYVLTWVPSQMVTQVKTPIDTIDQSAHGNTNSYEALSMILGCPIEFHVDKLTWVLGSSVILVAIDDHK